MFTVVISACSQLRWRQWSRASATWRARPVSPALDPSGLQSSLSLLLGTSYDDAPPVRTSNDQRVLSRDFIQRDATRSWRHAISSPTLTPPWSDHVTSAVTTCRLSWMSDVSVANGDDDVERSRQTASRTLRAVRACGCQVSVTERERTQLDRCMVLNWLTSNESCCQWSCTRWRCSWRY